MSYISYLTTLKIHILWSNAFYVQPEFFMHPLLMLIFKIIIDPLLCSQMSLQILKIQIKIIKALNSYIFVSDLKMHRSRHFRCNNYIGKVVQILHQFTLSCKENSRPPCAAATLSSHHNGKMLSYSPQWQFLVCHARHMQYAWSSHAIGNQG